MTIGFKGGERTMVHILEEKYNRQMFSHYSLPTTTSKHALISASCTNPVTNTCTDITACLPSHSYQTLLQTSSREPIVFHATSTRSYEYQYRGLAPFAVLSNTPHPSTRACTPPHARNHNALQSNNSLSPYHCYYHYLG